MATHVHKLKRVILGGKKVVVRDGKKFLENKDGYIVYRCMLPKCTTYYRRELTEGKSTICWKCGAELIMSAWNLRQVKPTHRECQRDMQLPEAG